MYAIKPRQIINYDAGIVLIDPHQLNVKTTSDNTNQQHRIRDNLMSTKNRTRRTTTRNIRFPNQMIEQINIALDQKGSGNFSAWVIEACRRRLTSEKRAYTSIKSDEEWISRFLYLPSHPAQDWRACGTNMWVINALSSEMQLASEQDDIVNSPNYEALQ